MKVSFTEFQNHDDFKIQRSDLLYILQVLKQPSKEPVSHKKEASCYIKLHKIRGHNLIN